MALHNTHSNTKSQAQKKFPKGAEGGLFPRKDGSSISHVIEVTTNPVIVRALNLNPGEVIYFDLIGADGVSVQQWNIHGRPVVLSEANPMQWINFIVEFRLRSVGGAGGGTQAYVTATTDQTSHEKDWDLIDPCCEPLAVDLPDAQVYVTKTFSSPAGALVGSPVSFVISVPYLSGTQGAPVPLNGVVLSDPLPPNFTVTSITHTALTAPPTVAQLQAGYTLPGLFVSSTYSITVNGFFTSPGTGRNTAIITIPPGLIDNVLPPGTSTIATVIYNVLPIGTTGNFRVRKTGPASVVVNQATSFQINVDNQTASASGANNVLTDMLPSGFVATSITSPSVFVIAPPTVAQLAAGWVMPSIPASGTLTLDIAGTFSVVGSYTNVASIQINAPDLDTSSIDNSAVVTGVVTRVAVVDLGVTKAVTIQNPVVNQVVTFTVRYQNFGGATSTAGALLTDVLPANFTVSSVTTTTPAGAPTTAQLAAGWPIPSLTAGQFYDVVVEGFFTSVGVWNNQVTIAALPVDNDLNTSNNGASVTGTVAAASAVDLAILKVTTLTNPAVGQVVGYTIRVQNQGSSASTAGAILQDIFPPGFTATGISTSFPVAPPTQAQLAAGWPIPSLLPVAFEDIGVTGSYANAGPYTNTATITAVAADNDTNTANNTSSVTGVVSAVAPVVLAVTKSVNDANPAVNAPVVFTITVLNSSATASAGALVQDVLPLTFVATSVTTTAPALAPTVAQLAAGWVGPSVPGGGSYTVSIAGSFSAAGAWGNTASVSTVTPDVPDTVTSNITGTVSGGPAGNVVINASVTMDLAAPGLVFPIDAPQHPQGGLAMRVRIANTGTNAIPIGALIASVSTPDFNGPFKAANFSGGVTAIGPLGATTPVTIPTVVSGTNALPVNLLPGEAWTTIVEGYSVSAGSRSFSASLAPAPGYAFGVLSSPVFTATSNHATEVEVVVTASTANATVGQPITYTVGVSNSVSGFSSQSAQYLAGAVQLATGLDIVNFAVSSISVSDGSAPLAAQVVSGYSLPAQTDLGGYQALPASTYTLTIVGSYTTPGVYGVTSVITTGVADISPANNVSNVSVTVV